jgi:salicylate hydroxylase
MAQGAVMAIEDAAVLMRAFDEFDEPKSALKAYEHARLDRTARIVDESSEHARLYHFQTHEEFREAFARKDPAKDRGLWLYNYNPLTVPLTAQPT